MNTTTIADVRAARQGDLLRTMVTDHATALLTYTERLLHDRHAAEDIVQETFIRAWPQADRLYSTEGSVRGWLLTVARNLVIDRMRSAAGRREHVGTEDRDAAQPDHSDAVLSSMQATGLLRQLSREHREVLLHTFLCDRTVNETARILGIPAGTVKSRRHYALDTLRARVAAQPLPTALPGDGGPAHAGASPGRTGPPFPPSRPSAAGAPEHRTGIPNKRPFTFPGGERNGVSENHRDAVRKAFGFSRNAPIRVSHVTPAQ